MVGRFVVVGKKKDKKVREKKMKRHKTGLAGNERTKREGVRAPTQTLAESEII